jgi:hypothetical protein
MASTINGTSTGNGGLISTGDDSGILNIQTNETTAITVDASQNVGIKTSSPNYPLEVNGSVSVNNLYKHSSYNASMAIGNRAAQPVTFITDDTERMRIDSEGDLCVGTTATNSNERVRIKNGNDTRAIAFQSGSAAECGYIYINAGGTTTTYATSSDYRLKDNIAPMTGALAKIVALKPVTYKWKINGFNGQGFIAHELQEVVPDCVIGTKDQVNEDGNPVYQGIDTSFLVATLTAALQETKALIDTQAETINALTARIVALEGK